MIDRVLEAEVMDLADEATEYDSMDHSTVNRVFVEDLLDTRLLGQEVLDIGTGTAQIPIELCRQNPDVRIIGVDLAPSMLDMAKINIELAGLNDRILLDLVDAKQMDLETERFDATISNSIVHHIPNPEQVLAEAVRVTRTGGLIFFRDLIRPDSVREVEDLVASYTQDESSHAQEMFYNSLRAALTVAEIQQIVVDLGFDPASVTATSDRHWTWTTVKQS